jgi:hypothetical protein
MLWPEDQRPSPQAMGVVCHGPGTQQRCLTARGTKSLIGRPPRCERVAGRSVEVIRAGRELMPVDRGQLRTMQLMPFAAAVLTRKCQQA